MKTLRSIIPFLIISFLLWPAKSTLACGFYELDETIRLSLFRAELSGMSAFRPFYYSANYFNSYIPDPENNDALKNCTEWHKHMGKKVAIKDIDFILYQTPPEVFENALQHGRLTAEFEGNSFIRALCQPAFAAELKYLCFAKELEYLSFSIPGTGSRWESWDGNVHTNYGIHNLEFDRDGSFIETIKDPFLKLRYAFQLVRLNYYETMDDMSIRLYDKYFAKCKEPTILKAWALLFKAKSIDRKGNHVLANYLYSQVFDQCDEKKVAVMQYFNTKPGVISSTLKLTKTDYEKGVIQSMLLLNYPAPALFKLREMQKFLLKSKYFAPLIMREINKLEDWIYTPMYTEYGPAIDLKDSLYRWDNYDLVRDKNLKTDLAYLAEFKSFLLHCLPFADGENEDYLNLAIAHLSYMNSKNELALSYLLKIDSRANSSIKIQKGICSSLLNLRTCNLNTDKTRHELLSSIVHLERIASTNNQTNKCLYSLLRVISSAYYKNGNIAEAGLMFLKSEQYKVKYEDYSWYEDYGEYAWPSSWRYFFIGWFDRQASLNDMDQLIELITKRRKSSFETYLCNQKLPSLNDCYDLRATIAFRNNDLNETEKSLEKIPQSYYRTTEDFAQNLNENPFLPKCFDYVWKRDFKYPFSKLKFIKTLISLKKSTETGTSSHAEEYIKLGHAYFNCSYFGNSWMMVSYGTGTADETYGENMNDFLFGPISKQKNKIQSGNYYGLTIAKQYYSKALSCARNDEQKAMASLMLHICDYYSFGFHEYEGDNYVDNDYLRRVFLPGQNLEDFYFKYYRTETFKTYRCTLLDDFMNVPYSMTNSFNLSE